MASIKECRKNVETCRERAEAAITDHARCRWLAMATFWQTRLLDLEDQDAQNRRPNQVDWVQYIRI